MLSTQPGMASHRWLVITPYEVDTVVEPHIK